MPAGGLGHALVGIELCLKELAKVVSLKQEGIYVEPIEKGSIKTILRYIKKHPTETIFFTAAIVSIFNDAFSLIEKFGASSFKNPNKEIIEQITDKKILDLCRSYDFRNGLQKVAEPISETNQRVQIIIGETTAEINCENKSKFYVNKEEEPVLPELINGDEVVIKGEITRINKKQNDLGFSYKGYNLNVSTFDKEKSTALFHEYLEAEQVELRGIVIRNSNFDVPRIKVTEIEPIENRQKKIL